MRLQRVASTVALLLALTGCVSMHRQVCTSEEQSSIYDSLYFGAAKPGGVVSPEEWADFLIGTVTPRFPQGLTAWQVSGQWRGSDGAILREASYVLNLVHPDDPLTEKAVLEIVAAYKSRFRQEAVLRVKTHACTSFGPSLLHNHGG
jgi:hypothetical protein